MAKKIKTYEQGVIDALNLAVNIFNVPEYISDNIKDSLLNNNNKWLKK